ncbi:MAG: succinate dehydrogenase, cytochrome b556 subunit [Sphingomonadaceae bacterium]|nr:succinate dehydrogenase, cytochrome b556 subunit [Sphingomonadaceae bacterium]
MASDGNRPLSPHLQIWKWGPHMLVSILHRVAGSGMAVVGGLLFAGWLLSAAMGESNYACFMGLLTVESGAINIIGLVFGIGLTWAFFTHLLNGLRHFVLDTGAGYELQANKRWAILVVIGGIVATAALWLYILWTPLVMLTGGA